MNKELTVILPSELADDYDVEYDVKCNKVTANIRKKFDFDSIPFKNSYQFLKPISDRLKEFDICTNNMEFWIYKYLLIQLQCDCRKDARHIADALGIDINRIIRLEYQNAYVIKRKNES